MPLIFKPRVVMGIDNSTKSTAYSIFENEKLVKWGELEYTSGNVYDRLLEARLKMTELMRDLNIDILAVEDTINVRSISTAIKMAYSAGVVMSVAMENAKIVTVSPLSWQRAIGNPPLTTIEKNLIKKENPGKSKSWYTNANREFRKNRTMAWVKKEFDVDCPTDNISDAIGIGWTVTQKI